MTAMNSVCKSITLQTHGATQNYDINRTGRMRMGREGKGVHWAHTGGGGKRAKAPSSNR